MDALMKRATLSVLVVTVRPLRSQQLRGLGVGQIELLTDDNERTTAALAGRLEIVYRANLLPEARSRRALRYSVGVVPGGWSA
jgi:hypothetical protein